MSEWCYVCGWFQREDCQGYIRNVSKGGQIWGTYKRGGGGGGQAYMRCYSLHLFGGGGGGGGGGKYPNAALIVKVFHQGSGQ